MNFCVRNETELDRDAIYALHRLTFNGNQESLLVDNLRNSGDAVISLVVEEQEKIAGHILFSKLTAPMRALALAPLAVELDFQKRGIGSALVRAGIEQAKQAGWDAIFVLGDPAYYGRFGFSAEAAGPYDSPYSGPDFMLLPLTAKPIPKNGQIVYPKAFTLLR